VIKMRKRISASRYPKALFVILVLSVAVFALVQDQIDRVGVETHKILREYERTRDPKPLRLWLTGYRGEATGHEVMIVVAEWAIKHQSDFIFAIEGIQKKEVQTFVGSFAFALTDASSDKEFRESFKGHKSKVLTLILAKLH
jgi:hypothetical protein